MPEKRNHLFAWVNNQSFTSRFSCLTASVRFVALKENSGRQTVELVPRSQNHLECTKTCAFFTICLKILLCNYKACFKSTSLNPWIVNFRFGEVCILFLFLFFFLLLILYCWGFLLPPPPPHTHTPCKTMLCVCDTI